MFRSTRLAHHAQFVSKLKHPVPLSLLQHLATLAPPSSPSPSPSPATALPPSMSYLSPSFLSSLADSTLLRRGRLSVQPCEDGFFEGVREMGEKGGWDEWDEWRGRKKGKAKRAKKEDEGGGQEGRGGDGEEGEKAGRKTKRAKKA